MRTNRRENLKQGLQWHRQPQFGIEEVNNDFNQLLLCTLSEFDLKNGHVFITLMSHYNVRNEINEAVCVKFVLRQKKFR